MACFSEQMSPIWTSPSYKENTCGRSMEVSVIPSNWNVLDSGIFLAMMKNQGPSGDACR